jgi:2-dehydro-3-deoxyphosphogluconate aldolase/(4S)-4-hydroxy-2-oxoglutarate aldolase
MPPDPLAMFRRSGIVPVVIIEDPANAVPLARALLVGGLPVAEIAFRTRAAAEAIRRMTGEASDILVGAGTVLTPAQVAEAKAAGASFVVSPGCNPRVLDSCRDHGLPVFPGVCTPTEIEAALERGLRVLKFFPAEACGGLGYLQAMAAPYGDVEFIPTGGINATLLPRYLAYRKVVACGGSWMAPATWIAAREFDRVRLEVESAVRAARAVRGGT